MLALAWRRLRWDITMYWLRCVGRTHAHEMLSWVRIRTLHVSRYMVISLLRLLVQFPGAQLVRGTGRGGGGGHAHPPKNFDRSFEKLILYYSMAMRHFRCRDRCRGSISAISKYRKTPLISTYLFSGLASVQVLIFGGRTYFRGVWYGGVKNPARKTSVQSSAFRWKHAVVHVSAIIHIRLGYRGTYIWGYILSWHCSQQQISVKNEGVLIFGGVLIYEVLRYFASLA